jgi:hypothetical protein
MGLREQFAERRRRWEEFSRWEAAHPPPQADPETVLANLGIIWSWLPEKVRLHDPDPEKLGIQQMHRVPPYPGTPAQATGGRLASAEDPPGVPG